VLGGGLLVVYFILPELLRFFTGEAATQLRDLF
jgi:flagellar biosynthetic protein FliR